MPADGVLDIDLACRRGRLCISQPADRSTIVTLADHPAACMVPAGPQTIPFLTAEVPMSAGGAR